MNNIQKRLEAVELAAGLSNTDAVMIIYDPDAGPPPPPPAGMRVVFFLPDNGRGDGPGLGIHPL